MNVPKLLSAAALLFIVSFGGAYLFFNANNKSAMDGKNTSVVTAENKVVVEDISVSESTEDSVNTFTLAQVSEHNSAEDCWLAVEGKVYEVTSFVSDHPGGVAILKGCGKDASEMFKKAHEDAEKEHEEKDDDEHAKPSEKITEFYIGDLEG